MLFARTPLASSLIVKITVATVLSVLTVVSRAGVYVDADIAYATPSSDVVSASAGPAFSVGVGTELNSWFALELDYVRLGGFSVSGAEAIDEDDLAVIGLGAASDFNISGVNASALLSWRPNRWDNFYLRAGYMAWNNALEVRLNRGSHFVDHTFNLDGQDPMFGLGYAYLLGGNMESSIEYNRYFVGDVDIDVLALGLNYHF
ncbi:outer membrane beta-barrel protein [Agaribacterium sp. ZY112]|uniref:outer membrane beta-barrel protein n=1 Tax=Agaribacterium sp. ZY112 TaxID=3233574 RepID=UPI0035245828